MLGLRGCRFIPCECVRDLLDQFEPVVHNQFRIPPRSACRRERVTTPDGSSRCRSSDYVAGRGNILGSSPIRASPVHTSRIGTTVPYAVVTAVSPPARQSGSGCVCAEHCRAGSRSRVLVDSHWAAHGSSTATGTRPAVACAVAAAGSCCADSGR